MGIAKSLMLRLGAPGFRFKSIIICICVGSSDKKKKPFLAIVDNTLMI